MNAFPGNSSKHRSYISLFLERRRQNYSSHIWSISIPGSGETKHNWATDTRVNITICHYILGEHLDPVAHYVQLGWVGLFTEWTLRSRVQNLGHAPTYQFVPFIATILAHMA
jgi:hypothetical protein